MAVLKYDVEVMQSVKNDYTSCIKDMKSLKKKMQNMVSEIEDAWKSEAGTAFFEKFNDEWLDSFTQYVKVLEHMSENLDYAKGKYSEITKKANAIKLDLD